MAASMSVPFSARRFLGRGEILDGDLSFCGQRLPAVGPGVRIQPFGAGEHGLAVAGHIARLHAARGIAQNHNLGRLRVRDFFYDFRFEKREADQPNDEEPQCFHRHHAPSAAAPAPLEPGQRRGQQSTR